MSTRDMMPEFELFQPADLENAFSLFDRYGESAWKLAGGQDSLDWFKDRNKRPLAVIDLKGLGLSGITETAEGIEIGALTTLTAIAENAMIRANYGLLATAAGRVASPQIRNVGTLGGNLCQDARCWYYRSGLDCYRAGGNTCYADSPEGMNREHCLFGAERCVAVTPSDTAPALVALDAVMVVQNAAGIREIPAEQFFIGPEVNIEKMTVLEPGDILTSVKIPAKWAGARFYFEKVADRATWDFALVNVASAMLMDGDTVARGATTLNYNHFKIPLMENLVRRAIRDS